MVAKRQVSEAEQLMRERGQIALMMLHSEGGLPWNHIGKRIETDRSRLFECRQGKRSLTKPAIAGIIAIASAIEADLGTRIAAGLAHGWSEEEREQYSPSFSRQQPRTPEEAFQRPGRPHTRPSGLTQRPPTDTSSRRTTG